MKKEKSSVHPIRTTDKTWEALKKKKVASGYNWDRFLSKVELKK